MPDHQQSVEQAHSLAADTLIADLRKRLAEAEAVVEAARKYRIARDSDSTIQELAVAFSGLAMSLDAAVKGVGDE